MSYDRAKLIAAAEVAADRLTGDPDAAPFVAWLSDVLEAGFTKQAAAEATPAAPRGGAHGRDEAVDYSRRVLTQLREREFRHLSKRGAALAICAALAKYLADGFEKNSRAGLFPSPEKLEYHLHDLIRNGAVLISGRVVDWETIERRFISPQIEMPL